MPPTDVKSVEIDRITSCLREAAAAAATATLPHFRAGGRVDNKKQAGFDPVTVADRDAELAIRRVINHHFPDHDIVGEEHESTSNGSDFCWIIDPIDGTRAFISGLPVWGTLIGVADRGKVFAGLMAQPYIGEVFLGVPGHSTLERDGQVSTLRTSAVTSLSEAKLFTTTPSLFRGPQRDAFDALERGVLLPRYGCDCYAYCLLAAGHVDLVVEPRLNIYDIAALIPIIRNAGGVVTSFDGDEPDQGGDIIAAATPELAEAAMRAMRV